VLNATEQCNNAGLKFAGNVKSVRFITALNVGVSKLMSVLKIID
jgi:hypothetical protein